MSWQSVVIQMWRAGVTVRDHGTVRGVLDDTVVFDACPLLTRFITVYFNAAVLFMFLI